MSTSAEILKFKLRGNPHFPVDEIDLLPDSIQRWASPSSPPPPAGECVGSSSNWLIEEVHCTMWDVEFLVICSQSLGRSHNVQRVIIDCTPGLQPQHAVPANEAIVSAIESFFTPPEGEEFSTAHTLQLRGATPHLVCDVIGANIGSLRCLSLEDCFEVESAQDCDSFNSVLAWIEVNHHLEEVPLSFVPGVTGTSLELIRKCPHVTFAPKPDLKVPPPGAGARMLLDSPNGKPTTAGGDAGENRSSSSSDFHVPIRSVLSLAEFREETFQSNRLRPASAATAAATSSSHYLEPQQFGLMTAYGSVVPLVRQAISRFLILSQALEAGGTCPSQDDALIPIEILPPVGAAALNLAVHFVTYYVTDEVHWECLDMEERGPSDPDFTRFTWSKSFNSFWEQYIKPTATTTSQRNLHILCELMTVAVFLNAPSLKRFVRGAIVMTVDDE